MKSPVYCGKVGGRWNTVVALPDEVSRVAAVCRMREDFFHKTFPP